MNISKIDLDKAVKADLISQPQANKLWLFWQSQLANKPAFQLSYILYYLGGIIAVSAVTLFITTAWEAIRGGTLLTILVFLFMLGLALTQYFKDSHLSIPTGMMAIFSLVIVPLSVYNAQIMLGYFPKSTEGYVVFNDIIDWRLMFMEASTVAAGLILFYIYRATLLLLPIIVLIWLMSLDFYNLYLNMHGYHYPSWSFDIEFGNYNIIYGLVMLGLTTYFDFYVDDHNDYSGWLYIVSVGIFWIGLKSYPVSTEFGQLMICLVNFFMLIVGAILNRRIFAVFGIIGILLYLGHLSTDVFANSLGYPVALVMLGIVILFMARYYAETQHKISRMLLPYLPAKIAERMKE